MLEAHKCKNMNDIRESIDSIDEEIVKLIAHRVQYVKEASKFKVDETAVKDSNRVSKVIASKKELALKHGISEELIGNIYEMMIDFFIKEELEEWNSLQKNS
jgi:isochorismate pyruvate lyase